MTTLRPFNLLVFGLFFSIPLFFGLTQEALSGWPTLFDQTTPPDGSSPPPPPSKDVAASMGDVKLLTSEIQDLLSHSDPKARQLVMENPKIMEQTIRQELLKKFILHKAGKEGFDQRADVRWLMERAGEQALIDQFLSSISKPEENYPPETMLQEAYQKNITRFQLPAQVHLAQIFIPGGKDEKQRRAAESKINPIVKMTKKKGADFAALAKKYSLHEASASQGGDMGWIPATQLLSTIRDAASGMKIGEIKGPISSPQGVHLIQLLGLKEPTNRPFEEVKPILVAGLRKQKADENRAKNLEMFLEKFPMEITDNNLSKLK